ncbi:unnamed protein product, partial [Closterium sp. NIES-64]
MARRRRSPIVAAVICLLATHLCAATATHTLSLRALETPAITGSTGSDGSRGSGGSAKAVAGATPSTATPGSASSRSRKHITGRHVPLSPLYSSLRPSPRMQVHTRNTSSSSSSSNTVYRPLGVVESGCDTATCVAEKWRCGVMSNPIKVYLIWHGAFSHAQKEVVRTFVRSLSSDEGTGVCQGGWWDGWGGCCENGSLRRGEGGNVKGWWDISELYDDCDGNTVSAEVSLGGEMQVRPNAMRLLLGERSIVNLVRMGINRRKFPADEDGVYFVIGNRYSKQVRAGPSLSPLLTSPLITTTTSLATFSPFPTPALSPLPL